MHKVMLLPLIRLRAYTLTLLICRLRTRNFLIVYVMPKIVFMLFRRMFVFCLIILPLVFGNLLARPSLRQKLQSWMPNLKKIAVIPLVLGNLSARLSLRKKLVNWIPKLKKIAVILLVLGNLLLEILQRLEVMEVM